jgi:hypoxanthine phosphoribosyltransferase
LTFPKNVLKISLSLTATFFKVKMKKTLNTTVIIGLLALSIGFLQSCKNKDPSVAKVYVRTANQQIVEGAQVVIIGDVDNSTATVAYVDTLITNSSGFAQFNMDAYFEKAGKENSVGVFDVIIKKGDDYGDTTGFRVRVHNTAVRTIYFRP